MDQTLCVLVVNTPTLRMGRLNLDPGTSYSDQSFCGFLQPLQTNAGTVFQNRSELLLSTCFTIYYLFIILPFKSEQLPTFILNITA
jgi:hypothetical protein